MNYCIQTEQFILTFSVKMFLLRQRNKLKTDLIKKRNIPTIRLKMVNEPSLNKTRVLFTTKVIFIL